MRVQQVTDLLTYAALLAEKRELQAAGFFASTALELILPKLEEKTSEGLYDKRIEQYCNEHQCGDSIREGLFKAKRIRNKIIHDLNVSEVDNMISYLCNVIALNKTQILDGTDPEDFRRLRKKFSSSSDQLDSLTYSDAFAGFSDIDFRNLHEMRNSLKYLQARLTPYCHCLSPKLLFDDISEPNSAYVWLAAVDQLDGHRSKIDNPSISVLLTNQDMRIYLDFGGRCKAPRKKYYKNLLEGKYDPILKELNEKYRVFDVYWYFNLENICTIQEFVEKRDMGELIDQRTLLDEVEDFIGFVNENRTIPENKLLMGRILSKEQVVDLGEGVVDLIQETYKDLLPIFSDLT